jgi:adenine phosphoribosyltransferase
MKIINNRLENELNLRTEKDFPKEGIEFIDINPLMLQNELFKEITDKFCDELKDKKIDYIIGPEARGFIFGSTVAYKLKTGFIPVRKKGKLPPSTVAATFEYEKEYGKDILELPKLVDGDYTNKNFYIIDDIYATGNTMKGIENAVKNLGGNVVGKGVVINIIELNNDKDIYSLIDINES